MALTDDIPSADVDILKKNMQVTDEIVNSKEATAENRPANNGIFTTQTFTGMNDQVNDLIDDSQSSFDSDILRMGVINLGTFASGIEIKIANQALEYNGQLYTTTEELPYTTTGTTPDNDSADWFIAVLEAEELPAPDVEISFKQDSSGIYSGNFSFSRASTRGNVNKSGVSETLAVDELGITKNGAAFYGSYTNLLLRSEDLLNTGWSATNLEVTLDSTVKSSDNITDSYRIDVDTEQGAERRYSYQRALVDDGSFVMMYIEAKAGTLQEIIVDWVSFGGGTTIENLTRIDLITGEILQSNADVSFVQKLNNGWVGIWFGSYQNNTGNANARLDVQINAAEINEYLYVNRAMMIKGYGVTYPYIKTNGTEVTAAADNALISASNNLPAAGQPFTISLNAVIPNNNSDLLNTVFRMQGDRTAIYFRRYNYNSSDNGVLFAIYDGTSTRSVRSENDAQLHKWTCVFDGDDMFLFMDGELQEKDLMDLDLSVDFDLIYIGKDSGTINYLNSEISDFKIWHSALTAEQVARLGSA